MGASFQTYITVTVYWNLANQIKKNKNKNKKNPKNKQTNKQKQKQKNKQNKTKLKNKTFQTEKEHILSVHYHFVCTTVE